MLFDEKQQDASELFSKKEPESEQEQRAQEQNQGPDRVEEQIREGNSGQAEMDKLLSHWVDDELSEDLSDESKEWREVEAGITREPMDMLYETGMDADFVPSSAGPEHALDVGQSEIAPIGGTDFGGGGGGGGGGGSGGGGGGAGGGESEEDADPAYGGGDDDDKKKPRV